MNKDNKKQNNSKCIPMLLTLLFTSLNVNAIELDNRDRTTFAKGSLHWVTLSELRPTQPVIAHDQVNYKLSAFAAKPKKMYESLCESYGASEDVISWDNQSTPSKPESFKCAGKIGEQKSDINTVIVGPGGKLYLTDGHHSFSTFYDMKEGGKSLPVYVKVQENWSSASSESEFWKRLDQHNNSWRYDANGQSVEYFNMPKSIGRQSLTNDPYRGVMYFAKKIGWNKDDAIAVNYLEFHWANELRNKISISERDINSPEKYLNKIKEFSKAIIAIDAQKQIGTSGHTAEELGKKEQWNSKSDKSLNKLLCYKHKLGKLGFALKARNIAVPCQ